MGSLSNSEERFTVTSMKMQKQKSSADLCENKQTNEKKQKKQQSWNMQYG